MREEGRPDAFHTDCSVVFDGGVSSGLGGWSNIDGQTVPQRTLLALSKHEHTLAMVDPTTLKVIARAPVGPDPHEVIASADGKTAYVSIYGGGRYHALSVIDLVGEKALPDIDTGALNGPHGLTVVGGKVWFTAEGAKAIARFDPESGKIDWIMGTGQNRTHMIYVTPDQKRIYATNVSSATVSILDYVALPPMGPPPGMRPPPGAQPPPGGNQQRMDWTETVISVGKGDEGFDVSPDGRELWTANAQDGTLSVIDLASRKVDGDSGRKDFRSEPAEVHARRKAGFDFLAGRRRSSDLRCGSAEGVQAGAHRSWSGGAPDGSGRVASLCLLRSGQLCCGCRPEDAGGYGPYRRGR